MSTSGDANLDPQRAVMVASLLERLNINFDQVIADEFFVRAHNMASVFPFICLIIELSKLVKVPIISGVDNKVRVAKGKILRICETR